MRLSLVRWYQRPLRDDQRPRTLSMRVLIYLIALGSPAWAVAQSAVNLPKVGLLTWDACEMPDLIAGLKSPSGKF
jgi:putative tryptophan/tyrosine transport system substrate-binding protein